MFDAGLLRLCAQGPPPDRRWTMKSNPCCIIVNPRTPKFQCCLWAARLGPVDKKIKPWTQRKLDRVLCNIEIWGVGFYLVDVCGVWFFLSIYCLMLLFSSLKNLDERNLYRIFCTGSSTDILVKESRRAVSTEILSRRSCARSSTLHKGNLQKIPWYLRRVWN